MKESQQIAVTIEQCEEQVGLYEALLRLEDNDDFQLVITNNLLREEAIRAVHAEADENLTPEGEKGFKHVRICIGQLETYFRKIKIFGQAASRALIEDRQTQEDIRKEEMVQNMVDKTIDESTKKVKVLKASDASAFIELVLQLTGHNFSGKVKIPIYKRQKKDF